MNENETPLPADPARQADAMLRACEYQVLHTVSAWLDLRGDQTLVVEGAEDFDRHSPTEAEAVQVKTSPKPISLGQKEIQQALNNYWNLRRAAPGRLIRFRFLTCASFTVENGSPFGKGVAGLEVWQRTPLSDDDADRIGKFLAGQPHLVADFRRWLEQAKPSEVKHEIVDRVTWQTNAEGAEFVERGILNKLAAFAEKRGAVPASLTKQVMSGLVDDVWKLLRKPAPRSLDFFGLEERWEMVTRVSVPRSALDARWNETSQMPSLHGAGLTERMVKGIPPLPGVVAQRSKLVEGWRGLLSGKGVLNLHGSTRTGKTTLAKLIAMQDGGAWHWWSAARMELEEFKRAFSALVLEVARSPDVSSIVLDDLDFAPATAQIIENSLGELLALARGRRGRVVITSQKPLPGRLQHIFEIDAGQIVVVPKLDIDEVAEIAAAFGCSDENQRKLWARVVYVSTGGHPQLTAVRLLSLKGEGWPKFAVEKFQSGTQAIEAEKADARQLCEGLPVAQRDLLQRISVFPESFRRDHAIALGASPPPLSAPGSAFDPLVGPWLEPLHGGYFALSPLLADSARAALSTDDFVRLQRNAAGVLLRTQPVTTAEGAKAFLLSWQTCDESMVLGGAMNWEEAEPGIFEAFAKDLWWFAILASAQGQYLFQKNKTLSLILRVFQFRVAMVSGRENATKLANAWRWEVKNYSSEGVEHHCILLAGTVLTSQEAYLSADLVVALLCDVAQTLAEHPEALWPQSLRLRAGLAKDRLPEWNDLLCTFSYFTSSRCRSIQYLDELLTALEATTPEIRIRILRGFSGSGIEGQLAVDRCWLTESEQAAPNWSRCIAVFERTLKLARDWNQSELVEAAIRGICVVLDEYVKDHVGAHQALDLMQKQGGAALHSYHDRRASIFFSEESYAEAEEQWKIALENWPKPRASFDHGAAFAARSAGLCAARQHHWLDASVWFFDIVNRLPNADAVEFKAGAYADAGYCLWKAGEPVRAVRALVEAWRHADTLPVGREDLRAFITRKTVGHVIAWLHGMATTDAEVNLHEPIAGTCSSAEMPEKMRELPETENANVWLFLMRLERQLNAGNQAEELGQKAIQATTSPATRSLLKLEKITREVVAGRVSSLPADIVELTQEIQASASLAPPNMAREVTRGPSNAFFRNDALIGASVFLAGLVVSQAAGRGWQEVLSEWRNSETIDKSKGWNDWFDTIDRVLSGSLKEAAVSIRAHAGTWELRKLCEWKLMLSDEATPEDLFIAHVRWLSEVPASKWLREAAVAFCCQAELAWGRTILRPALLRMPRLSIPAIEAACKEGERGIAKAARILLAAATAVSSYMDPNLRVAIQKLADDK